MLYGAETMQKDGRIDVERVEEESCKSWNL